MDALGLVMQANSIRSSSVDNSKAQTVARFIDRRFIDR